ncbi:TPA: S49 family peptidase [Escherichia coli]|nr:S49 family peptidase [Escherichia coli]HDS4339506.1 S49 family peptidase [Escherichia coli]HDS4372676.1 S49 family peptidase [Escherichia coli]HDS4427342.1 S49 family peptidase [Escherichia coli]HDS7680669.1 S49 family peptidase [Escherichia coli]
MPWNNFPHLAARAFNQPLLLEPTYARVFFSALSDRFGTGRLIDTASGEVMNSDEMNALAMGWDSSERTRQKSYRVERGIAVLPVTGTLVHKLGYINPVSGMSGYNGIAKRLQQAISDPDVRGVLLDIDSPGGEVAGAHKVDGNPYSQLPGDVRDEFQLSINSTREQFAQKVSDYTGLKKSRVLATEAAVFIGADAIKSGLADQLVNYADAIAVMADALKPKMERFMSGTETTAETTTTEQTATTTTVAQVEFNTEQIRADAASSELARVMAIINCPEAVGREAQAKALAGVPGMTVGQAQVVLAAAPKTAQARTETALDTLMSTESPATIQDAGSTTATGTTANVSMLVAAGRSILGDE